MNVSLMLGCQSGWEPGCQPDWATGYIQSQDGWSYIEPIEHLLVRSGMDPTQYAAVLSEYDHVIYNVNDVIFKAAHE